MTFDQKNLCAQFSKMHKSFENEIAPSYEIRIERLRKLEKIILDHQEALIKAMSADFSFRSSDESRSADITFTIGEIRENIRHLKAWMKPRKLGVPKYFLPARGYSIPQPLGVVGVISPWNFPIYLAISPAAAAIAAGNRVMIKPSEATPRTAKLMFELINAVFEPEVLLVVLGDVQAGQAFSELPFQHLLFTGSTEVGRLIAMAAAKNLTPVTLELGGKSPAIIGLHADLKHAARRIAFGKTCNAGQICVAPDYLLVPKNDLNEVVKLLRDEMMRCYDDFTHSKDYTALISDAHQKRIRALISEAESEGAQVIRLGHQNASRQEPPVLIIDPKASSRVMQEEIFGPILPIIPYETILEAQKFVASRPHPLALYIFSDDKAEQEAWIKNSTSGGACVNETLFHVSAHTLPFGGVGASGIGAYHGRVGFERFSHMKSVFYQSKLSPVSIFAPPYTPIKRKMASLLQKFI